MIHQEEFDPVISVSELRTLAAEAERCGARRYAEAYRLIATRLCEMRGSVAAPSTQEEESAPQVAKEK